jgi:ATP phosphoribosyltransferase regulatory subunit
MPEPGQKPAVRTRALERLTERACSVLDQRGFRRIEPAILQPAELYLDEIGEELRSRTYVFTDPDGEELCLRPDLTLPTCRIYLDEHPAADAIAKLAYHGPAFRYQPDARDPARPREFHQIGLESFGVADRVAADAEVVATVDACLSAIGVAAPAIRIGDLGLVHGLIAAIDMPERWRRRLRVAFERPDEFRRVLRQLCTGAPALPPAVPSTLVDALDPADRGDAEARVQAYLDSQGIAAIGVRSVEELTGSLLAIAEDRRVAPLPAAAASLIERVLSIDVPAREALAAMQHALDGASVGLDGPLDLFARRLSAISATGLDIGRLRFTAAYGRGFAYYTGLVFQYEAPGGGRGGHLAGGGRYDALLQAAGAPRPVPAVGAAMHSERLLALLGEGGA